MREAVRAPGQVITFYSYKGGTGRSMALANVACLLAQRQTGNVLMVDWDLEAPGLHRYFCDRFQVELGKVDIDKALDERPGLIDLFLELDRATRDTQANGEPQSEESAGKLMGGLDLQRFILRTDIPSLHLLKAGQFSEEYAPRVNSFDWVGLYQRSPWLTRALAERLTAEYQYVLIDSRTGLTDISGICTMLMPERLVVVFTPNRQSLTGVLDLIRRATKYRRQSDDLRPLIVFPLPSRIDDARPILRDSWRFGDRERGITGFEALFEEAFKEVYDLGACDLHRYFDEVQVYHVPDYAYGEEIAVLVERGSDRRSLSRSFESFANTLVDRAGPWEDQELAAGAQSVDDEQSRAAEAAFARLKSEEQDVARRVFTSLVVLARPGEGGEDTRRRAWMSELGPEAAPVVKALVDARLVTVSQGKEEEEEAVELASDALVRNWPRLRQWLENDRDFLLWRQQLRNTATDWENNQLDTDLLLRRSRLKETERRLSERRFDFGLSATEHRFLRASAARRQRLKVWWVLGSAVTSLVLAIIVLFYIDKSQQQSTNALASKLAARALTVLDGQRDLALLLSLESLRLSDTPEGRGTLLRTLQLVPPPSIRAFLRDSKSAVGSIAFSRDGGLLAAGNEEGILLWNAKSGNLLVKSSLIEGIDSIAFSPDGTTLASGGKDGVALWMADGSSASSLPRLQRKEVDSVAFSPDGRMLASGSDDHSIILWDVTKRTSLRTLQGHTGEVDSLAFSPDGKMLASGSEDGAIILWDPKTGVEVDRLLGDRSGIDSVAISPDGKVLAAGTDDNALVLWDVATRKEITRLQGHTADINSVAFSPDSAMLASGSYDGAILLWNVAARQQLWQISGHDGPVQSLAFSLDGKTLASSGEDRKVILWDIVTFAPSLGQHLPLTGIAAFRPDGKLLTVRGNAIDLWDVAAGKILGRPAELPATVRHVAVSRDGKLLAASSEAQILLWDVASQRLLGRPFVGHEAAVFGVAFSPDGKLLASASEDHNVRLWDVASRQPAGSLIHTAEVLSVAFSPEGKTLASGDFSGNVYLWDVASRQRLNVLAGQQSPVFGLSFRPDGEMLASSDGRGNIFLWNMKAAQPFGELLANQRGGAYGVSFSPDGKTLVSSGDPATLWDVDFNSWRARACSLANRNLTRDEWKAEIGDLPYQKTCPNLPEPSSKPQTLRNRIS